MKKYEVVLHVADTQLITVLDVIKDDVGLVSIRPITGLVSPPAKTSHVLLRKKHTLGRPTGREVLLTLLHKSGGGMTPQKVAKEFKRLGYAKSTPSAAVAVAAASGLIERTMDNSLRITELGCRELASLESARKATA